MLEKLFALRERNTNVNTEITAGITTFMAMAYILFSILVILTLLQLYMQRKGEK